MSTLSVDDIIKTWQEIRRKPGELVGIWNYELEREDIALVLKEEQCASPYGPKVRFRKVHVMVSNKIEVLSKFDVFPIGYSRSTIPF